MSDMDKQQFLDTLSRMGKLAASLPEICPEVSALRFLPPDFW